MPYGNIGTMNDVVPDETMYGNNKIVEKPGTIESTKFIELDYPGLQKWRSSLKNLVANNVISAISFSPNVKQQVREMANEIFHDLSNTNGFEDVRIDFSSTKYPDVEEEYISTVLFRGDVSHLIIAQVSDYFGIVYTATETQEYV